MARITKEHRILENDFVIRVRPFIDDEGEWTGEIDLSILSQPDNTLTEDDYFQLMHFTKMVAASIPVMEDNESIRELVHEYVTNVVDKALELRVEPDEDNTPKIVNIDNNVISVDFPTKGNA